MDILLTYSILLICIAFVGVVANLAVIIAISVNKKLQTTTNFLLLNLSCADLLDCLVAMPARIVPSLLPKSPLVTPCNVTLSLSMTFGGASRMNTLLIAVDRYIAIKWPFWYKRNVNSRSLLIAVLSTWLLVLVVAVLPTVGFGLKQDRTETTICYYFDTLSIPFLYLFILTFNIFPLVMVIPINCFLFRVSFLHMQKIQSQRFNIGVINPAFETITTQTSNDAGNATKRSKTRELILQSKVARMIAILIFTFVIFVAPISIIDLIQVVEMNIDIPDQLSKIAIAMIYLNTWANVFIYAGYNKEFRKTFQQMFKREREPFVCTIPASISGRKRGDGGSVNTNSLNNNIELLSFRKLSE